MIRLIPTLVLVGVFAACSSPTAPDPLESGAPAASAPASAASAVASAIIGLTNHERAAAGLSALRVNARLMQAAELQADQLLAAGQLAHDLPGAQYPTLRDRIAAVHYSWRAIGENLAWGQRDAAHAVQSWMGSDGHRANILNSAFTEIGAATLPDRNGRVYYVQVFGRPQ